MAKSEGYFNPNLSTDNSAWGTLSIKDKASMIEAAVKNGITNMADIRKRYNEFAGGGETPPTAWSYDNWKKQIALHKKIYIDGDRSYDYEGFFNKYPQEAWAMLSDDPDAHFSDEFKTVYHPTFSAASPNNEGSIYSGVKHPIFNPEGLVGGTWSPDYKIFTMSPDGYRGPVSMDERKWYIENAEDNGVQLREADGCLPIYDGILWAGVLPNVTIKGNKPIIGPIVDSLLNEYASGGELGNYYDGWGDLKNFLRRAYGKVKRTLSSNDSQRQSSEAQALTYRNRPAERVVTNPFEKEGRLVPVRQRSNTSKTTKKESETLENMMRSDLANKDGSIGSSNPDYDIPYIPEKSILIDGSTTSTNVLDSLAKYAGIHNRNPKLSQYPSRKISSYETPRQINRNEMLGLSTQETHNGAMPIYNYAENNEDKRKALNIDYKDYNRALGNANYFTAFGYVPAENLVRNFQYNKAHVDRTTPPLLDAFRYYAQGDYNPGDPKHTSMVNDAGKRAWNNPEVKKWWELSGKYWYNTGKGPKK